MDSPEMPEAEMAAVLRGLERVNRLTLARRPTISWLSNVLKGRPERMTIVDVGAGHGDMLRAVHAKLRRWGAEARLIGYDIDPRCTAAARIASAGLPIEWVTGDATQAVATADIVLCSLVTHHMRDDELIGFLRWIDGAAQHGFFINDLRRSPTAWRGFKLMGRVLRFHPVVRHDGALSIERSFTPDDWGMLLRQAQVRARVEAWTPYRLCVSRERRV
jgi:2-polyprenyl-3-methyl-5-hydroxy-6-metoxy-1,4-benzoquinol methylase